MKRFKPYLILISLVGLGVGIYKIGGGFKLSLIAVTAAVISPLLDNLKKYFFPNMDSLSIFLILVGLDVVSGILKHWGIFTKGAPNTLNKDDFFFKLFRKILAGSIWLTLVNTIDVYSKSKEAYLANEYLDMFGVSVLIAWMSWSIAENVSAITNGDFPPIGLMKKLRLAKDTGDIKQVIKTNNET